MKRPGLPLNRYRMAFSSCASIGLSTVGMHRNRSTSCGWLSSNRANSPGAIVSGRLYCTSKALWKLGWFLRDFLYDNELLGHEEVDEKALSGLRGVVKISHTTVNGTSLLNFDGFARASHWPELSSASCLKNTGSEVAL